MHELSEASKRLLDLVTAASFGIAALTINDVAGIVTIGAGLVSIACGAIRIHEWGRKLRSGG